MAFVELEDGGRLYYEVHGDGEPLVLLNGIMMNALSWTEHVPPLASKVKVVLVDFRDQGRSSKLAEPYDLDRHAADLAALVDALDLGPVHVLGLSYGGQVALRLAVRHGTARLKSLILANVVRRISNHLRAIGDAWETAAEIGDGGQFFRLAIPFIYSAHFYERSHDFLVDRLAFFEKVLDREWLDALIRLSRATRGYEVSLEQLAALDVPTLLLGAEDDLIAPVDDMRELYRTIPGCEMLVFPAAGHAAFLERRDELVTALLGFVGKHA